MKEKKEILKGEELLAAVFESIQDGISVLDIDLTILMVNHAVKKWYSHALPLEGKKCFEAYHGRHEPCEVCPTRRALKTRTLEVDEVPLTQADGIAGTLELFAFPTLDEQGKIAAVVEYVRDITPRKRTEDAFRKERETFSAILENNPHGIAMIGRGGRYVYLNPEFTKITGYTLEEVPTGREWLLKAYPDPEYRNAAQNAWKEHRRSAGEGRAKDTEFKVVCKGGQVKDIVFRTTFLKDYSITVLTDITQRRLSEEGLRESEERYRTVIENSNDGIAIIKGELHVYVNKRFVEMFGYDRPEDVIDKPFSVSVHPDDQERVRQIALSRQRGENVPSRYEFKGIRKDGAILYIEVSATRTHYLGQTVALACLRDITERKRLETQLQHAQRMEALGTLAGGIAHDFNNLLMGIQGRASLMLLDSEPSHPHYEQLKGIEDHVRSAADLTKQLLGFARGGRYEVRPSKMNDVLKKCSHMFGRTKKEIQIHSKYQEDIWSVEADEGQIEQVLLNLFVNAWQAMPGGGDLYLQTANVILDEAYVQPYGIAPGRYVKISVTDTGTGMDEMTIQRIFEPFFTTKEMGRGTGLGLASAYGIIRHHGGVITVYSEKGQGSTFNIYLPATEKNAMEVAQIAEEVQKGSGTILLVDDEDMILEVGGQMLESIGYKVIRAKGGKEALRLYREEKDSIQLVILDMVMPGVGGRETFEWLKEENPGVKVLLSSGYSVNGQAKEILSRGCDGFIQKPFRLLELSKRLKEILERDQ